MEKDRKYKIKRRIKYILGLLFVLTIRSVTVRAYTGADILQAQMQGESIDTGTGTLYRISPVYASVNDKSTYANGNSNNPYQELKVPTQITKIGNYYFLVDCYHDQVLYSQSMAPLKEWKIMTNRVNHPHTVAGDGRVYLVDDTDNNRVLVFEKPGSLFQNTQTFQEIGTRPHCIVYDKETASFYVWSSVTGDMYIMRREPDSSRVYLAEVMHINELAGFYIRSFTIMGDRILFPSGNNGYITVADKYDGSVVARYPVPEEISGMAQIIPIGDYYYMTVSTDIAYDQSYATMVRGRDLSSLQYGQYEKIYDQFQTEGTPYFISRMDGSYFLANHRSKKGIIRFQVQDNAIVNVAKQY